MLLYQTLGKYVQCYGVIPNLPRPCIKTQLNGVLLSLEPDLAG